MLRLWSALRWCRAYGVLVGMLCTVSSGLAQTTPSPVPGDWLVMHILSDPESLNPRTSRDAISADILDKIFETLLDRHPQTLELRPRLATARPQISEDKLTYTFTLRQGAHFQDGKAVTGEDLLFSLKVIKNPWVNAPFLRVYYQSLATAVLTDAHTLRLTAREPYFLNETILSGFFVMPRHYYDPQDRLAPVSVAELDAMRVGKPEAEETPHETRARQFAEAFNKDFVRNPLGSGPYKFHGWKTGQEIVLQRDERYWGLEKAGIDQPYIGQYTLRVMNDTNAALAALKAGQLDSMLLTPLQHQQQSSGARFDKQFAKHEFFSPSYTYIGWNNAHPIFQDMRVRQAMTLLTNRRQMLDAILFGLGEVVDGPIYLFRPEYDASLLSHPYDPQKALQFLGEAGWKDSDGDGMLDKVIDGKVTPLRFEIKFNSGNPIRQSVALALQDEVRKHGIEVSVRQLDWTIFLDDVRHHRFDAVILGWRMQVTEPDAYQVWHSSQADNHGSNYISYKNARVDTIIEEYRRTFEAPQRIALYHELQQILHWEQPYTFLFLQKSVLAVDRRFHNVVLYPNGPRDVEWWVPQAQQRYHHLSQ